MTSNEEKLYVFCEYSGLQIVKKDVIYWEDGLYLRHESGYLMVESTLVPQAKDLASHSGVLITVQSTKEDYSIMGIVVDEIDDLLNDHYPGIINFITINTLPS